VKPPELLSVTPDIRFTEDIREAPDSELVCYCSVVSKGQILQAIRLGGKTLEDIKELTNACGVGRCKELNPRHR
jgi:NAD(P)H-nitrite reductase large subunit